MKHVKENDKMLGSYGNFGKWIETLGMAHQHANRFMRIVSELDNGKYTTSFNLGVEVLYQIATMPEKQRTQPQTIPSTGEVKTVDEMTVRELREVKKALKEAEAKAKQAEIARRDAEIKARQLARATEPIYY